MSTITVEKRADTQTNRMRRWLLQGVRTNANPKHSGHDKAPWWQVMCLTGVDYFSTLGYQPGIAFLAAGILSPLATGIVVLVTLFGLVPLYGRVAKASPFGQGSIAMLEKLLPGWLGKAFILMLLGFAATDFIITITLSAADATAHIVENPLCPSFMQDRIVVTAALILALCLIFLKGFKEAIGLAVLIVGVYLAANGLVAVWSIQEIIKAPHLLTNWHNALFNEFHSIPRMIGVSLLLFPKLALGMSGFETGVAVMPLVKGDDKKPAASGKNKNEAPKAADDQEIECRIKNTGRLLTTAAVIMAVLLLISSVITTVLIPPELFKEGGAANGRALAYLAHKFGGEGFGTIYDLSTIAILWFAGASAMAGLLNLVPRYLPRYGMAPSWSQALRPLVLFFTFVSLTVTVLFKANVDAQAGAYATGVLVLFTSASLAVVLSAWKESKLKRTHFLSILIIFIYTTIANMYERPEGLQIASFFIAAILCTSLVSRAMRSLELRILEVNFDEVASSFVEEALAMPNRQINLLAHRPGGTHYETKELETRRIHKLTDEEASFIFLEVSLSDPSEFFDNCLRVEGHLINGHKVLRCHSAAIPNAIAAILLHLRDETKTIPHAYFGWTEGNPLSYVFRYIFLGEGETAPVTREILREVVKEPHLRPVVIVG
ncbi:MAG: hypothetical protein JNN26_00475 [Candidatus Obscuribacter sp.]|nr:hypothetical protein [Candidatus Obscuribacter sp.]